MTESEFESIVTRATARIYTSLVIKAKEYTTSDRLSNFKETAALTGQSTEAALLGFVAKHITSLYDWGFKSLYLTKAQLEERIMDIINYMILLEALISESQPVEALQSHPVKASPVMHAQGILNLTGTE